MSGAVGRFSLSVLASCGVLASMTPSAFGEGSVDMNTGPDSGYRHTLTVTTFATGYTASYTIVRVYARAGELLQLGSSTMWTAFASTASPNSKANILVFSPGASFAAADDPAKDATLMSDPAFAAPAFDCRASGATPPTGRIASRAQEVAGPLPNAGGYRPCEYRAPADGIYAVVFKTDSSSLPGDNGGTIGAPVLSNVQRGSNAMWDVTVRDASGAVRPGRVFSNRFALAAVGPTPAGAQAYLRTPTGYDYRVQFQEHQGAQWMLVADDRGVVDAKTGDRLFGSFRWGRDQTSADNLRAYFEAEAPSITAPDLANDRRFPIFVNRPDPEVVSGPGGLGETRGYSADPITSSSGLRDLRFSLASGALATGGGGTFSFASPVAMNGLGYTLEIDADRNGAFEDAGDVRQEGNTLASAGNSFVWDGRDANGAALPCTSYRWRVRSTPAEAHLIQTDVENSGGTRIERLTLPDDPALGDPLAVSYNDVDPFKNTAVTNADPPTATQLRSGTGFHRWGANTGNGDFVDTWLRLPEIAASGIFENCLVKAIAPGVEPLPPAKPLAKPPMVAAEPQPTRAISRPRLTVTKTVNRTRVRAGRTATFTIKVRNTTGKALRNVRVCDTLPAGVVPAGTKPKASMTGGRQCWTVKRLAAGRTATFRTTVRTLAGSRGRKAAPVTASAPGARSGRAEAGFLVYGPRPASGGVTG